MSTNLIFKVPGRTTNYMPVNINASKNEILEKYARGSFSTANDWPQDSPSAGFYDVKNSDTKLILLNNQKTFSHLRGKTKAKHETFRKDPHYDWVEKEIEMKKQSESDSSNQRGLSSSSRIVPDPSRHLIKSGCSHQYVEDKNQFNDDSFIKRNKLRRNKSAACTSSHKSIGMSLEEKKEEERLENEILLKYLYAVGKRTTGLQTHTELRRPPSEFLSSYNINHPEFNKGQRLFLNELCSMYSVAPLKQSKKQQYIKLFKQQTDGDMKHRPKYRMHGGDNFELYKKWLYSSERPLPHEVNCGYYAPPGGYPHSSKSLKSRSMINKQTTSSFSNASSFASNSTVLQKKPQTAPPQRVSRPVTAKQPKIQPAKAVDTIKVSSSSDEETSKRLESQDYVKKLKDIEISGNKETTTDSSEEPSSS